MSDGLNESAPVGIVNESVGIQGHMGHIVYWVEAI